MSPRPPPNPLPDPDPAERPEKKGLMDRLKEKVGLGEPDEDVMPADEAFADEDAPELPPAVPGGTGDG